MIDTPDVLPVLPSWQMGSDLRANDLNVISSWQRWLYDAADGLPGSLIIRPAYRWDLSFSGEIERRYGDLVMIHQYRYLIYKMWPKDDLNSPDGGKIKTVNGWLPENEESLPSTPEDEEEKWMTVDLSQHEWLFVGIPYYITGVRYAVEADVPYEF